MQKLLTTLLLSKIFDIEIFNSQNIFELLVKFVFNFVVVFLIIRYFYYPKNKRIDYIFTFFLFSTIIFLLCFMLAKVNFQIGFAFGLFAIFGLIRYRTNSISISDMTFLFVIIGISIINSLKSTEISISEIVLANIIILCVLSIFKIKNLFKNEICKKVTYDKIELIKSHNHKLLIADLQVRTGIKISRISIEKINFSNDSAQILIYYFVSENPNMDSENSNFDNEKND